MRSVIPEKVQPVIAAIHEAGGRPLLVGGAVRDHLINADALIKDLDFEVYHIAIDLLIRTLSRFGRVETVGSSFAVIKLFMSSELDIDFALPRRESKKGQGHRGFVISADPDMPPEEACARRDFTINAMLMDPVDGTLFDFFGGQRDLENRILRHTSHHFDEDPLRPLRAMQFAARFGLRLQPETATLSRSLGKEALSLAEERIFGEWEKWALHAPYPSRGLEILAEIRWDTLFGDLTGLAAERTDSGTRWGETLDAVDRAAALATRDRLERSDRLVLMLGALCHAMPTVKALRFVERLGTPNNLLKRLTPLLAEIHGFRFDGASPSWLRRLSVRLAPETVRGWITLISCLPISPSPGPHAALLAKAERLGVADGPPAPLVTGKALIAKGVSPGREMGQILKTAFDAQLAGEMETATDASRWLERFLASGGDNS